MHIRKMKLICPSKDLFSEELKKRLKKKFDCAFLNLNQKKFNKIFYKYDIILTRFNQHIPYKKSHSIKYILSPTTGINHIDSKYFNDKKVKVFSLKNEKIFLKTVQASTEFTILLIMMTLRNIKKINNNYERRDVIGNEIYEKKIGIIGLGRIGLKLGRILKSFGAEIYGYDNNLIKYPKFVKKLTLNNLLKKCDIISINIPLNQKNSNFLNKRKINLIKKNALLINSSRGEIVDEKYILKLVRKKKIYYSTDVIKNELKYGNKKFKKYSSMFSNLLWTKHIGGLTKESILKTDLRILKIFLKYYESKKI